VIETDHMSLPGALIFGPTPLGEAPGHHHADQVFETGVYRPEGPVDLDLLAAALTDPGSGVLRAKGVLTGLDGVRQGVQMAGRRWRLSPPVTTQDGMVWIARKGLDGLPKALEADVPSA
jgi:hypothetical protein